MLELKKLEEDKFLKMREVFREIQTVKSYDTSNSVHQKHRFAGKTFVH